MVHINRRTRIDLLFSDNYCIHIQYRKKETTMPRLSDIRPAFYAALRIGPKGKRTVATDDSVRHMALVEVI